MEKSQNLGSVTLEITSNEIRNLLTKRLGGKDGEKLADIILVIAAKSSDYYPTLVKALLGVEKTFKFKIGDEVCFSSYQSRSWYFDEEAMQQKGLLLEGKKIKGIIESIDIYNDARPYNVSHPYVKDANSNVEIIKDLSLPEECLQLVPSVLDLLDS